MIHFKVGVILENVLVQKIVTMFINKKRLIGWGAAVAFAVGGAAVSMDSAEFKKAVCDSPVIESK